DRALSLRRIAGSPGDRGDEARIERLIVEVPAGAAEPRERDCRLRPADLGRIEPLAAQIRPRLRELIVEEKPRAQLEGTDTRPCADRREEGERPHEVRRELPKDLALAERLLDQMELEALEIPQAAVDQLARAARGLEGEVVLFDQAHRPAVQRRF